MGKCSHCDYNVRHGGREVHFQGYFQNGGFLGGTVNHIDDCAVSEELESLNNSPRCVAYTDCYSSCCF